MTTTFDAILKIAAQVTGADKILNLANQMKAASASSNQLATAATQATSSLGSLGSQLKPSATAGAVAAFTSSVANSGEEANRLRARIQSLAGPFNETNRLYATASGLAKRYGFSNADAATAVADLYSALKPMGKGLKDVETVFGSLIQTTRRSKMGIEDSRESVLGLTDAVSSGRLRGSNLSLLLGGSDQIAKFASEMDRGKNSVNKFGHATTGLSSIVAGFGYQLAALVSAGAITAFIGSLLKAGDESTRLKLRIETLARPLNEVDKIYSAAATAATRFGISNQEAAQGVADIYSRLRPMGVSMKDVETAFFGLVNASRRAGLGMSDAKAAALQFGQALGSGKIAGDELRSLLERIPGMADKLAKAFNNVAQRNGLSLITKDQARQMTEALKDGEKNQIANLKETINEKQRMLRQETNDTLREIQRRYAEIERQINDRYDDEEIMQQRREDDLANQRQDAINDEAERQIEAIQRSFEDQRRARIDSLINIGDDQKIIIERQLQDRENAEIEAVRNRARALIQAEQRIAEDQQKGRRRLARDAQSKEMELLQERQRKEEDAINEAAQKSLELSNANQEKQIEIIKSATTKMRKEIIARTEATAGDIKKLGEEGLLTAKVGIEMARLYSQQQTPPPTGLQLLTKAFQDMRTELGKEFLPMLEKRIPDIIAILRLLTDLLILLKPTLEGLIIFLGKAGEVFNLFGNAIKQLPKPAQDLLGIIANLSSSFAILNLAGGAFLGLNLGEKLVQITSSLGSSLGIQASLASLLGWTGSTFVPAMIAFFTGPAGWITLAMAAVVSYFRDPIVKAFEFAFNEIKKLPGGLWEEMKAFPEKFQQVYVIPLKNAVNSSFENIKKGWNDLLTEIEKRTKKFTLIISDHFANILNNNIKNLVTKINLLISGFNNIAKKIPGNSLTVPLIEIPKLASGGYANRRSLVEIAEAGEGEYAIPESKMRRASVNYLGGARGIDVLNGNPALSGRTTAPTNVTIQIQPGYVRFNGEDFVHKDEIANIVAATAQRTVEIMGLPETRIALSY